MLRRSSRQEPAQIVPTDQIWDNLSIKVNKDTNWLENIKTVELLVFIPVKMQERANVGLQL